METSNPEIIQEWKFVRIVFERYTQFWDGEEEGYYEIQVSLNNRWILEKKYKYKKLAIKYVEKNLLSNI